MQSVNANINYLPFNPQNSLNGPFSFANYNEIPQEYPSDYQSSNYHQNKILANSQTAQNGNIEQAYSNNVNYVTQSYANRECSFNNYSSHNASFRRKNGIYANKGRIIQKQAEPNFHKSCPGCYKQWRYCKCSNIKNRPRPKRYEKFVPPRMLRKEAQEINDK